MGRTWRIVSLVIVTVGLLLSSWVQPRFCDARRKSKSDLQATYGVPFSTQLDLPPGAALTPPLQWSLVGTQNLPGSFTLDPSTGVLSGSPERIGSFKVKVRVQDSSLKPRRRQRTQRLVVGPPEFSTSGRQILMNGEPFYLKGIDYGSFIAGDAPWTKMKNADPEEDLAEIKHVLNANVVRVYQALPKKFYNAARENGLFVIQGIHFQVDAPEPSTSSACLDTDVDLFDPPIFNGLKKHVLAQVRTIHRYKASDVILGYVAGNEVNFCAQRSTILKHQDRPRYQGTYYSAPQTARFPAFNSYPDCAPLVDQWWDPHPFQSFVAELADAGAVMEASSYGVRHLWGHATDPNSSLAIELRDSFFPQVHFPIDLGFLDIVFQNVYSYFPPAIRFLGFREYLEKAAVAYPDRPFVVLECGYSTSPLSDSDNCAAEQNCGQPDVASLENYCFGNNTEAEQAAGILSRWQEATQEPLLSAGFFVFEYYDEWWKAGARSQYVQDEDRPEEWFGIKGVHGTPRDFRVVNKLAFDVVSDMFSAEVGGQ